MKRAKMPKGKKKSDIDEMTDVLPIIKTITISKSPRITDLNQSKYLSPCRSVGLTKRRKICSVTQNSSKDIVKRLVDTSSNCIEDSVVDIGKENKNVNLETRHEKNIPGLQYEENPKKIGDDVHVKKPSEIRSKLDSKNHNGDLKCTLTTKPNENVCLEENFENFFEVTKNIVTSGSFVSDCLYQVTEEQKDQSNSETFDHILCSLGKPGEVQSHPMPESQCKIDNKNKISNDIDGTNREKVDADEMKLANTCIDAINKRLSKRKSKVKMLLFDMTDPDFEDVSLSKIAKLENVNRSKSVLNTKTTDLNTRRSPRGKTVNISRSKSTASAKLRKLNSGISTLKQRDSIKSEYRSVDSHCDDDDDFEEKKTTVERKSYSKANTTIKTIDEIEIRIERMRDQIIEAKLSSHVENEKELEMLIVKWRTGCQEALHELLKVTKEQMPGNENIQMDKLLTMLNLPAELVKYNSDLCRFE